MMKRVANLLASFLALAACGNNPGTSATTCGAGTKIVGNECVAIPADGSAPSGPSSDAGGDSAPDASGSDTGPSCKTAMLYPDTDGDGFGAALEAATEQCVGAKGYAGNNQDCADGDARAFPDQADYFDSPISGAKNVQPFDFDCDGKTDLKYPQKQQCTAVWHPPAPGWQGETNPIPACGEAGSLNTSACEEVSTKQPCH